jgi:hypothetical protein
MRKRILIALLATAFISVFAQAEFDPIKSFIKGWTDKGIATDYKAGKRLPSRSKRTSQGRKRPRIASSTGNARR